MHSNPAKPLAGCCVAPFDFEELRRALEMVEACKKAVGVVNPRPPGFRNHMLQLVKKALARSLDWYTRPTKEFNASVTRSLTEIYCALQHFSVNLLALDERLSHEQIELLHEQVKALVSLEKIATEETGTASVEDAHDGRDTRGFRYCSETRLGEDRTAYVLGLFGTGRWYINDLMVQNIGERAKYFRDELRLYPGPTSMICSGHVTVKYVSRHQAPPATMERIVAAVKAHPLDFSLAG